MKGVLEQHWREADQSIPLALDHGLYCQPELTAVFMLYCDVKYCAYKQIYFYINMYMCVYKRLHCLFVVLWKDITHFKLKPST